MNSFKIKNLIWDSSFFGYKIGKIDFNEKLNFEFVIETIRESKYNLVQIFSEKKILDSCGYKPIDIKLLFSKITPLNNKPLYKNIISVNKESKQNLKNLAIQSGQFSRYKIDKKLNHKFESMYTNWIEKSIKRELADEVFAFKNKNKIYGMVAVKKSLNSAGITLIAVNKENQNIGVGRKLVESVENWAFNKGLKSINVITQKSNLGACKFYKKNNFVLSDIRYIYHIWNKF